MRAIPLVANFLGNQGPSKVIWAANARARSLEELEGREREVAKYRGLTEISIPRGEGGAAGEGSPGWMRRSGTAWGWGRGEERDVGDSRYPPNYTVSLCEFRQFRFWPYLLGQAT